jgi:hypothetical protein
MSTLHQAIDEVQEKIPEFVEIMLKIAGTSAGKGEGEERGDRR